MNRSLIFIPLILAVAVGGWYLFAGSGITAPPELTAPAVKAGQPEESKEALPLLDQLKRAEATLSEQRTQGALNRPQLSLLARRAADGNNLPEARATIEPLQSEDQDSPVVIETGTTASALGKSAWTVSDLS